MLDPVMLEEIERQIQMERERCAKIAERAGAEFGEHAIGAAIAREIRKKE